MLLESGKEHFLDLVAVRSFLFGATLLHILEFDEIGVVRYGLVRVDDTVGGNGRVGEWGKNKQRYSKF